MVEVQASENLLKTTLLTYHDSFNDFFKLISIL